jgi:hypothetical protein
VAGASARSLSGAAEGPASSTALAPLDRYRGTGLIHGLGPLDAHHLLPLVNSGVVKGKVDQGRGRPLRRGYHLDHRPNHRDDGRGHVRPTLCLDRRLRRLVPLRLHLLRLRSRLSRLRRDLHHLLFYIRPPHVADGCFRLSGLDESLGGRRRPRLRPNSVGRRHL